MSSRPAIRVLLAIDDPMIARHVAALAAESEQLEIAQTLRDPQELRTALPRMDIDAVVLHDSRGVTPLVEVARELTAAHPNLGLVLIVTETSPDLLRTAMQAGARDILAAPISLDQLETSVAAAAGWTQAVRRRAARDAADEAVGLGRVVTVCGSKGGVGATTVALHLALAAREVGVRTVCLVDFDLQTGDLRTFLGLPYRRSVADLAGVADEISSRHLQDTLYTHASGVRVLLSPEEGEEAEGIGTAAARNILTAIRTREELTIVDAGATVTEASALAAEMADVAIIVTTPDVVALRGVNRLCSLWSRLQIEPPQIRVLLNRASRKLEIQPDLVRRVVPVPLLETTVAADFPSLEAGVNVGVSVARTDSRFIRSMASVLNEIDALPPGEPESPSERENSVAARLAGEHGQASIEVAGLLPLLAVFLVAMWQIVLIGMTFVYAGHAARAGARALAVGDPVLARAQGDLPGAFRSGMAVSQDPHAVIVKLKVPLLLPGVLNLPLSISSSSGTVIENQPLPPDQQTGAPAP